MRLECTDLPFHLQIVVFQHDLVPRNCNHLVVDILICRQMACRIGHRVDKDGHIAQSKLIIRLIPTCNLNRLIPRQLTYLRECCPLHINRLLLVNCQHPLKFLLHHNLFSSIRKHFSLRFNQNPSCTTNYQHDQTHN